MLLKLQVVLRTVVVGTFIGLPLLTGPALAHSNEYLETIKGSHGGQVRMAEMFHFEVVVKDREFQVWVTDHGDKAISTEGANGVATLLLGTEKVTVNLTPDGENRLVAKDSRIKSAADIRVSLTVTMKGQKALNARYAPSSGHAEGMKH